MPRWCYFVQLLWVGASPLSPAELGCRWQLWALKKEGHPMSSSSLLRSIHFSLWSGHTRTGLTHLCLLDFFIPRKKCTTSCWSWHVETNWLLCRAWPVETPFRHHISIWHLPMLTVCFSLTSELLGFWAIAFFQHGEPHGTPLCSLKERQPIYYLSWLQQHHIHGL